jgi:hypothetical protein
MIHMRGSMRRRKNRSAVRAPKEAALSLGPRRRRHDISELVAAMTGVEPPPALMQDEPRGGEIC